jgi:hypothetical protein
MVRPRKNVTSDELLARSLQQQEEDQALHNIQQQEAKRRSPQPLLFRAQTLAREIHKAVHEASPRDNNGNPKCHALLEASLTVLASRFIDQLDAFQDNYQPLLPCFTVSENEEERLREIRLRGFGNTYFFGSDFYGAKEALHGHQRAVDSRAAAAGAPQPQDLLLHKTGWIAVIAYGSHSSEDEWEKAWWDDLGWVCKRLFHRSLILAWFDPQTTKEEELEGLLEKLKTICSEFSGKPSFILWDSVSGRRRDRMVTFVESALVQLEQPQQHRKREIGTKRSPLCSQG